MRVGKVAPGAWLKRRSTEKMQQALSTMIFFSIASIFLRFSFQSSSLSINVGSTVHRKGERGRGAPVAWPEKSPKTMVQAMDMKI